MSGPCQHLLSVVAFLLNSVCTYCVPGAVAATGQSCSLLTPFSRWRGSPHLSPPPPPLSRRAGVGDRCLPGEPSPHKSLGVGTREGDQARKARGPRNHT